jgi:hypothetical protein
MPAGRGGWAWALGGALVAGVAIRVGASATAPIWFDEATTGLMGRDVLHGQFPFFFYGQTFMGAVDGYLHAVSFGLLGESVATLRTGAMLASLGHVALAALLAHRIFRAGGWTAALALVPTPYLLKWAGDARLHYALLLVLVPLCLLLTLAAADARSSPASRSRALIVLALVAGVCGWINLLFAPVLLACALTLALRRPRVGPTGLLTIPAFVLGSAPVWLFALVHGYLPSMSTPLAAPSEMVGHLRSLGGNALPLVMGTPRALADVRPLAFVALAIFAASGLLALLDRQGDRTGRLLLALAVVIPLATAPLTERGVTLATDDPRYLLPVLVLVPVLLGAAVARISRGRAWGGLAGVALVLTQGAAVAKAQPELRSREAWQHARAAYAQPEAVATWLVDQGVSALYTHEPDILDFVSGGRVTVSHFYRADDPVRAARVDGESRVAYLSTGHGPLEFDDSLAAAGIRFDRRRTEFGALLTDFRVEPASLREIPPLGWTATASIRPEQATHAIDRDAATRWRPSDRSPDTWLQVDLGRIHPVAMVAWLPGTYQEVPVGFRLDTSIDGIQWATAREVPVYYGPLYWAAGHPMGRVRWGRVEARFPPRPARFVRVTHLGQDRRFAWTVRELFVYEAGDPAPEPDLDPPAAAAALLAMGARRLYADHGEAARLVDAAGNRLKAPPDNVRVDLYGLTPPLERLPFLVPAPHAAVVFPANSPSGASIESALVAAGVALTSVDVGGYRLLGKLMPAASPGRVARGVPARVTAEPAGDDPRAAVDGRVETRWSTRAPQVPGQWVEVELEAPTELGGVELDLGGSVLEYPRGLAVRVAQGEGWVDVDATIRWVGPLVWTGTHVLRVGVERVVVSFPPGQTRGVRLVQTGRDGVYPWSIAELRLLAP